MAPRIRNGMLAALLMVSLGIIVTAEARPVPARQPMQTSRVAQRLAQRMAARQAQQRRLPTTKKQTQLKGSVTAVRKRPAQSSATASVAIPERDCLGLAPEKVQRVCGSGPLRKEVGLILNGYTCTYSALDPEGADHPIIGTQLTLKYSGGKENMTELARQVRENSPDARIELMTNGFLALMPHSVEMYRNAGPVFIFLSGTTLDYAPLDMNPTLECSLGEMWDLLEFIAHEDVSREKASSLNAYSAWTGQPPAASTRSATGEEEDCPCQIMIVEVKGEADVKRGDELMTAEKEMMLEQGDEVYVGENSQVVVAFFNCGFGPEGADIGIAIISAKHMGKITTKNGKPAVFLDPGVAQVSVKTLSQFQTDFQVSTPRMVCGVRG